MKGLTNATSWDVAWYPKPQTAKWCCWFNGHCLKKTDDFVSFFKGKILFSFTHASSPFPLETSGSFFKFNSFLFIYLFIFLKFNFLFIYLFPTYLRFLFIFFLGKQLLFKHHEIKSINPKQILTLWKYTELKIPCSLNCYSFVPPTHQKKKRNRN